MATIPEPTADPIDTLNKFGVSASMTGDSVRILMPPFSPMNNAEALTFAAWLVALADPAGERFPAVLKAVRNT